MLSVSSWCPDTTENRWKQEAVFEVTKNAILRLKMKEFLLLTSNLIFLQNYHQQGYVWKCALLNITTFLLLGLEVSKVVPHSLPSSLHCHFFTRHQATIVMSFIAAGWIPAHFVDTWRACTVASRNRSNVLLLVQVSVINCIFCNFHEAACETLEWVKRKWNTRWACALQTYWSRGRRLGERDRTSGYFVFFFCIFISST